MFNPLQIKFHQRAIIVLLQNLISAAPNKSRKVASFQSNVVNFGEEENPSLYYGLEAYRNDLNYKFTTNCHGRKDVKMAQHLKQL